MLPLTALGGMLLYASWGRWPDVLIDFGRELYVPWRLAEGATLYRDVAWFNGPLSAYWNALCFTAGGTGLRTLVVVNLALLVVLAAALYRLLRRAADAGAASAGIALLLAVFAFGQRVTIGNYNFVTPYSHELTHGLVLGVAALLALDARAAGRGRGASALAGLALGATLLTKPEPALATGAALVAGLALLGARSGTRELALEAGCVAGGALLAVATAIGLLTLGLPMDEAVAGVTRSYRAALGGELSELPFYRRSMGLDAPLARTGKLLAGTAGLALALAPGLAAARAAPDRPLSRTGAAAVFAASALVAAGLLRLAGFDTAALPLPPLLVGLSGLTLLRATRGAGERASEPARRRLLQAVLCVFATALLAKIALHPRFHQYGFALAMPAALVAAVALVAWLPRAVTRRGGRGAAVRWAALGLLAAVALVHASVGLRHHAHDEVRVGSGADAFRAAPFRGRPVAEALDALERRLGPGDTLAVLPEGVMLNYLLRRPNPTPYVTVMPPEVLLFGEERMLRAFRNDPPSHVALVHKRTAEYGVPFFGRDYGRALHGWIRRHYEPVWRIGDPPLQPGTRFGILLLERVASRSQTQGSPDLAPSRAPMGRGPPT